MLTYYNINCKSFFVIFLTFCWDIKRKAFAGNISYCEIKIQASCEYYKSKQIRGCRVESSIRIVGATNGRPQKSCVIQRTRNARPYEPCFSQLRRDGRPRPSVNSAESADGPGGPSLRAQSQIVRNQRTQQTRICFNYNMLKTKQ